MCGRYVSPDQASIERAWNIRRGGGSLFSARYNVAPSTNVPIIRTAPDSTELVITEARWGLIPHWWKEAKLPSHTINARSEDAATKPMWRYPYRHSRCLIPALGWYEWKQAEVIDKETGEVTQVRQPHFLFLHGRRPFCFAGLLAAWGAPDKKEPTLTCAILTRPASPSSIEIHDRMPVVLQDAAHSAWCDPAIADAERIDAILQSHSAEEIEHYAVSRRVNSSRAEGQDLILPLKTGVSKRP